jgi:hypothetical protein
MLILKWLAEGFENSAVSPLVTFRVLRFVMFMLSFVLEDWAIHDLVETRQQRRVALMLVASSYVTWTWQAHTFSNAVETVVVLWSIVLIKRLVKHEVNPGHNLHLVHIAHNRLGTFLNPEDDNLSRCPACLWHFQPHHVSCLCDGTFSATCHEKVQ